jgi:hypothetical protein
MIRSVTPADVDTTRTAQPFHSTPNTNLLPLRACCTKWVLRRRASSSWAAVEYSQPNKYSLTHKSNWAGNTAIEWGNADTLSLFWNPMSCEAAASDIKIILRYEEKIIQTRD